jgi:hypothetical protein
MRAVNHLLLGSVKRTYPRRRAAADMQLRWNMGRPAAAVALALMILSSASCALDVQASSVTGSFERTLSVDGHVDLDIATGSGWIHVNPGTDRQVKVVARIEARDHLVLWDGLTAAERVKRLEANPPVEQNGGSIRIGDVGDPDLRRNVRISYELIVPVDTRLRARTGSGDQTIDAIRGPVEARAGSGTIRIGRIDERAIVSTGSGDIELRGAAGLEARAGSGSIRAHELTGAVSARTGSGRVTINRTGPGPIEVGTGSGTITVTGADGELRARTGSGDITVEGRPSQDWHVRAGSGDVSLRVPQEAAFELDARTGSGGIDSVHPVETYGALSRRQLRGRVRGGGPRLDVTTASGSIQVR